MKQLFTLLFICLSLPSFGQDFAPQGATWHYSEYFVTATPYSEYFMKFEVTGDTVIAGQNCSIIHKNGKLFCYSRPDDEYVYSSNDTVFVFDPHFLDFRVLYDFNANAGDSWEMIVFGGDSATDIDTNIVLVDSTDFIQVSGQNLKRLHVTYYFDNEGTDFSYSSTIVERFGDLKYMFNYHTDFLEVCDYNLSGGLRCYEDSLIGLYETGIADSCEYVEPSVGLPEAHQNRLTIFPNPTSDLIEIDLANRNLEQVLLLDMNGRIVLRSTDSAISIAHLEAGMYVIAIQHDGQWLQERIVKQ